MLSTTPRILLLSVWPLPLSLATTRGISFDYSSSPYLDVSVQAVPSYNLCIQLQVHGNDSMWVSPFGSLRIEGYLHLPEAYRSLSRPSSAPSAKAFPLCSYQLGLLLKSSNLVLKFVASLHANRKSFEVFPLPFTFVMILLRIYLFYGKTFNNLNIIKNLPVSVVYAFFNTRIRFDLLSSIHFSMFFFGF